MREAIDHRDTDLHVIMVRVRVFAELARARGENIGRVDRGVESVGLARVDHDHHLVVSVRDRESVADSGLEL